MFKKNNLKRIKFIMLFAVMLAAGFGIGYYYLQNNQSVRAEDSGTVVINNRVYRPIAGKNNARAAGNTIVGSNISAGSQSLPGYNAQNQLSWSNAMAKIDANLDRINKEVGPKQITELNGAYQIENGESISIMNGSKSIGSAARPEGEIYVCNGHLRITDDTIITGKATFIVHGNLEINGGLSYANASSSIGFVVDNDVNIMSNVDNLVGAYYAKNNVNFQ